MEYILKFQHYRYEYVNLVLNFQLYRHDHVNVELMYYSILMNLYRKRQRDCMHPVNAGTY
jgi:hypothetical protein